MIRLFLVLCCMAMTSCGVGSTTKKPIHIGYVEGRLAHIAPVSSGRIVALYVREGDIVSTGDLLFAIDPARANTELANAEAFLKVAMARIADLNAAGRPQEISAAKQVVVKAAAAVKLAQENLHRSEVLVTQKLAPQSREDSDQSALVAALATKNEATARLALLQQPARTDQIAGAMAEAERLQTRIQRARIEVDDTKVRALENARVETVYRRTGELSGPGQPVLALLRPDQIRVRFFISETRLQQINHQMQVNLTCDGCETQLGGRVVFISGKAEFTPPVIFTSNEREKLKYMVEVAPEKPDSFRIGQPVEVSW